MARQQQLTRTSTLNQPDPKTMPLDSPAHPFTGALRNGASRSARSEVSLRGLLRAVLGTAALLLAAATAAQTLPLWELSKGERMAYLLGSLHIGTPEMFPLPPPMRKAFEFAGVVAVELDSSAPATQKAVTDAGVYPEGMTLDKEIGAEEWEKLRPVIQRIGLRQDVHDVSRADRHAVMLQCRVCR